MYRITVTAHTQDTRLEQKQENPLINFILEEMVSLMQKKELQFNFHYKREFTILSKSKGRNDGLGSSEGASSSAMVDVYSGGPRADFVITLREKNALVFEVKNEGLGSDGVDP